MLKQGEYITKDMRNLKAKQEANKCLDEVLSKGNGKIEIRVCNQIIKSIHKTEITETENSVK